MALQDSANWMLLGYHDAEQHTPLENAPVDACDDYTHGRPVDTNATDYWQGFDAAVNDAFASAQRTANMERSNA